MAPVLAQAWSSFAQAQADVRALAPQIRIPVQLCWAMRDRFIPLSRNRAATVRFPTARLEKFEDSGHSPFIEEPPHFLHVLQRFLDGLR
jgi:pimeloyl-ACP methyl ester carboxylesterase